MADEQQSDEVQRWTAKRRAALVISLLKGETTAAEAARRHGLKVAEVEEWRERFLLGAENALRARPKEDEALREEELNRLKRKVGELTIDLDIVHEANRLRPTRRGRRTSNGDVVRGIDAQGVPSTEISPRPAAGARGRYCGCGITTTRRGAGGTDPRIDRKTSDLWLSSAVGVAALR